ncbi:hypothetical protein GJAV_G00149030 [Gymnothorax javanicus]|nr:hypothetical protein GJAV_G00149030 [Gymnothorax javanicus]
MVEDQDPGRSTTANLRKGLLQKCLPGCCDLWDGWIYQEWTDSNLRLLPVAVLTTVLYVSKGLPSQ